jgi:hypothetical protein
VVILTTMIGFAILATGRQIFWIFIAGLGFALGVIYGGQFFSEQPEWIILMIGVTMGSLGALLANYLQRLAGSIAGFATGWYLTDLLIGYSQPEWGSNLGALPITIGVLCGLSILVYFDWSAIILSAVAGAAIITAGVEAAEQTKFLLLGGFAFLGAFIQGIWYLQENRRGEIPP